MLLARPNGCLLLAKGFEGELVQKEEEEEEEEEEEASSQECLIAEKSLLSPSVSPLTKAIQPKGEPD